MKSSFRRWTVMFGLAASQTAWSQAVNVTARLDTNSIPVGGATVLRVEARIAPGIRSSADRIFSWYLDVLNSNGVACSAQYSAMQKTASDRDPVFSSLGTSQGANRRGVFDTFLNLPGAGKDAVVELMAIPLSGLAPGKTRFSIQAGSGVAGLSADFLVAPQGGGDPWVGGDYSVAFVDLNVTSSGQVPAPTLSIIVTDQPGGGRKTELRYDTQPGVDYFVEYRDVIEGGAGWITAPGSPFNGGVYIEITSAPTRFYRITARLH
ncbi:MAG: hypothetical protein HY299_03935 [Verrucomicrobia bacterium]|nr:hypothetical protein [Verrucomicrobiota bacterium]